METQDANQIKNITHLLTRDIKLIGLVVRIIILNKNFILLANIKRSP